MESEVFVFVDSSNNFLEVNGKIIIWEGIDGPTTVDELNHELLWKGLKDFDKWYTLHQTWMYKRSLQGKEFYNPWRE